MTGQSHRDTAFSVGAGRIGEVASYDAATGYGELVQATTGERWLFHCTAIVDGSRTIDSGTPVCFSLQPGHLGRYEAIDVRPAPAL